MHKIAYLVSRFPKISETFILYEILALEQLGVEIELFPLMRQRETVQHLEAERWVEKAHYARVLSPSVIASQLVWLVKAPRKYLGVWWKTLLANRKSPKFLARAIAAAWLGMHFARQMQALGVEHVHAHWATHPTVAAFVIGQMTGLPYSFTAHAHDIYVDRSMLAEKIDAARFVVTISDYNRRFLKDLYGEPAAEKTRVIHCGVDTQVFRPPERPRRRHPFTMITVASLEEKKGHTYLIEACALLAKRGIDFRCLLVGEGDLRPALTQQIRSQGLSEQVVLLGYQPRARVNELIAGADAMILPSVRLASGKQEGIPVSLMEALAVELPAIATDISGVPELIEDGVNGLLVPERDPQAIAAAVERMVESPQFSQRLGAAGRAKVMAEFDLHENARALWNLINLGGEQPTGRQADWLPDQKAELLSEGERS